MSEPIAGHGALIFITMDPESPTVFEEVAQLNSDIVFDMSHETSHVTPHNVTASVHVVSPVHIRGPIPMTLNYIFTETTHDKLKDFYLGNTTFGMKITAPDAGVGDEIRCSGKAVSWKLTNPVRTGERKVEISFQPSGPFIVDGTLFT